MRNCKFNEIIKLYNYILLDNNDNDDDKNKYINIIVGKQKYCTRGRRWRRVGSVLVKLIVFYASLRRPPSPSDT